MANNENKKYYVYIWYRISDQHVFYVGKGSNDRAWRTAPTHRNKYFLAYINKYQCDYKIIKDNLSEHDAYVLENELNQEYKKTGQCECNLADTSFCNGGPSLKGELNGMYGRTHTPEVRQKLHEINSDGRHKGENNSQYGISPHDRMNEKTYAKWKNKHKRIVGSKNPNAHVVYMININTKEYKKFEATVECAKYLLDNYPEFSERYDSIEKIRYVIKHSNKTNAIYNDWVFKINPTNIDDTVSSLEPRHIRYIPEYERPKKM